MIRRYDDLAEERQLSVKESYARLLHAHERRDYVLMAEEARKILNYVDDYNDTKSYEAIAIRGLNQIEDDRKRHELEEKMRVVRNEVMQLEMEGGQQFAVALTNPSFRPAVVNLAERIIIKDPNNRQAQEWIRQLHELGESERRTRNTRELASLEIKGEGLVSKAKKDPDSRAQLYEISDRIRAIDPSNTYPGEWRQKIHHAP